MGDLAMFFAQKQSLDIYKDTDKQVLQFQQAKTPISADVKVMDILISRLIPQFNLNY